MARETLMIRRSGHEVLLVTRLRAPSGQVAAERTVRIAKDPQEAFSRSAADPAGDRGLLH